MYTMAHDIICEGIREVFQRKKDLVVGVGE